MFLKIFFNIEKIFEVLKNLVKIFRKLKKKVQVLRKLLKEIFKNRQLGIFWKICGDFLGSFETIFEILLISKNFWKNNYENFRLILRTFRENFGKIYMEFFENCVGIFINLWNNILKKKLIKFSRNLGCD